MTSPDGLTSGPHGLIGPRALQRFATHRVVLRSAVRNGPRQGTVLMLPAHGALRTASAATRTTGLGVGFMPPGRVVVRQVWGTSREAAGSEPSAMPSSRLAVTARLKSADAAVIPFFTLGPFSDRVQFIVPVAKTLAPEPTGNNSSSTTSLSAAGVIGDSVGTRYPKRGLMARVVPVGLDADQAGYSAPLSCGSRRTGRSPAAAPSDPPPGTRRTAHHHR